MTETHRRTLPAFFAALIAFALAIAIPFCFAQPTHAYAAQTKKIVFKLNGGKQASHQKKTVKKNAKLSVKNLKSPTKLGYVFAGWYTNKKCTKKAVYLYGSKKASKRTVYAKWTPKAYPITYTSSATVCKITDTQNFTSMQSMAIDAKNSRIYVAKVLSDKDYMGLYTAPLNDDGTAGDWVCIYIATDIGHCNGMTLVPQKTGTVLFLTSTTGVIRLTIGEDLQATAASRRFSNYLISGLGYSTTCNQLIMRKRRASVSDKSKMPCYVCAEDGSSMRTVYLYVPSLVTVKAGVFSKTAYSCKPQKWSWQDLCYSDGYVYAVLSDSTGSGHVKRNLVLRYKTGDLSTLKNKAVIDCSDVVVDTFFTYSNPLISGFELEGCDVANSRLFTVANIWSTEKDSESNSYQQDSMQLLSSSDCLEEGEQSF